MSNCWDLRTGLLLTAELGTLQVVAAASERTRLLELFQLQTDQRPCVDRFRTGKAVSEIDLPTAGHWAPLHCGPDVVLIPPESRGRRL